MKKTTKIVAVEVLVNYEGKYFPELDRELSTIARTFGGHEGDSGYSFIDNSRDIFFVFKNTNKGVAFMTSIRRHKGVNLAEMHTHEQ